MPSKKSKRQQKLEKRRKAKNGSTVQEDGSRSSHSSNKKAADECEEGKDGMTTKQQQQQGCKQDQSSSSSNNKKNDNDDIYSKFEGELSTELRLLEEHIIAASSQQQKRIIDAKGLRKLMPRMSDELMNGGIPVETLVSTVKTLYFRHLVRMSPSPVIVDEETKTWSHVLVCKRLSQDMAKWLLVLYNDDDGVDGIQKLDPKIREILDCIESDLSQAMNDLLTKSKVEENSKWSDLLSGTFCKIQLDTQCLKWANTLDGILFGTTKKPGSFLKHSHCYNLSADNVNKKATALIEKYQGELANFMSNLEGVEAAIFVAARGVKFRLDQINITCWECGTPCNIKVYTCTKCNLAIYCGKSCQVSAWEQGHKKKCKHISHHQTSFLSSLDAVYSFHQGGEEAPNGICLNECVDYYIFSNAIQSHGLVRSFVQDPYALELLDGPSMKHFYDNLKRVVRDGWWLADQMKHLVETDCCELCHDQCEPMTKEEVSFLSNAQCLCYDFVSVLKSYRTRDNVPATLQTFLHGVYGSFLEHGQPMSRDRFLEIYNNLRPSTDMKTLRRQLKQSILALFRDQYHK